MGGHIGNPLGADDVKGGVIEHAASEPKAQAASEPKLEELSSRRKPDPSKDEQLKKALDLINNPTQWEQSLGLAAKKPVEKKDKDKK